MARGIKMNVRFIDTSIMLNLLEVPGRCAEKERVKEEWRFILEKKETLIMPIATIIETGNHIAHIADGSSIHIIFGIRHPFHWRRIIVGIEYF